MRSLTYLAAGLLLATSAGGARAADEKAPGKEKSEGAKTETVRIGPASYEVPTTWKRERPKNEMRAVQYALPSAEGDSGATEFIVFYFGGQGGGVDENIKRWVGMFEEPEGEPKIEKMEVGPLKITTVDIAGTYLDKPAPFVPKVTKRENYRMFNAVVETPDDGPYFFRLVGPKKSVAAQEEAWKHLLKTASAK